RELESGGESEISSEAIGEIVMEHLRSLDDVAYVRFASVYRNFREAKDFETVLGELSGGDDGRVVTIRKWSSAFWRISSPTNRRRKGTPTGDTWSLRSRLAGAASGAPGRTRPSAPSSSRMASSSGEDGRRWAAVRMPSRWRWRKRVRLRAAPRSM